jgi:CheY-like chemotaxis protein
MQIIVVVDHSRAVQSMMSMLATGSPRRVLPAHDGAHALELLRSQKRVDLLAAELELQGEISGAALITRVRLRYPGTAVMAMTADRRLSSSPLVPVLVKPFTAADAARKIEQLLTDRRRLNDSLKTVFEWNRAAKDELVSVRDSLLENVRLSRQNRTERYLAQLRAPGVKAPTVLVAEDDPALRYAICRLLANSGFHVLEAPDGAAALGLSRAHEGPLELVLTDLEMPEMTGKELAAALAAERPETSVLLMTGDESAIPRPKLRKPFELDELLAQIIGTLIRQ